MEHDQSYKLLFAHARMMEDLVRGFVHGRWVLQVDFATLERVNASFVSDDLREREDDIIWRVRWGRRRWLYLYVLLEFQSSIDWFMAVRLQVYIGLLWQSLIRSGEVQRGTPLPPVLPLVLYNGRAPWNAPQDLAALVATRPVGLRPYQPQLRYMLLEERQYTPQELVPLQNLAAALFRMENSRAPGDLTDVLTALRSWLNRPEDDPLRRAFVVWLKRVFLPGRLPGVEVPEVQTLEEMQSMVAEQGLAWTEQWKAEGWAAGIEEGRKRGLEEGREVGRAEGRAEAMSQALARERHFLVRLARKRFSAATVERLEETLEAVQSLERLMAVADAIVECATDAEFLARVQG